MFSTNLGILDYVSRLVSDALKADYMEENQFWTMSKLYFAVIRGMILISTMVSRCLE